MTYGDAAPVVGPSFAGFVNGDDPAALTTQPTCSTAASSSSPSGSYATTCSGAADPNYAISYVDGAVEVNPAPLTITASSASTTYGSTPPAVTPVYSGFVNGDDATSLATQPGCGTTASGSSPVGAYVTSCSGAVAGNYSVSYVPGVHQVGQAALVIAALPAAMTYGGPVPQVSSLVGGFQNGESSSILGAGLSCSTAATGLSPVGNYPSLCSGAVDGNYAISYVDGIVSVGPAPVSITASSGAMGYGATPPVITPLASGLQNGEAVSVLGPGLSCGTTATLSSAVGTYASSCAGDANANYSVSYVGGTVTVFPVSLTVTASSGSAVYGGSMPPVGPSYNGFVNGDGPASLTTQPTCSTGATSSSPVASYGTTCQGAADPDYLIGYVSGNVSVVPAMLTVTADNQAMQSGSTMPALTASMAGFVIGQTLATSGVTGQSSCATTAMSSSQAGTYPITCSMGTLTSTSYRFAFVPGVLTVSATSSGTNLCDVKGKLTIGSHQIVHIGPGCTVKGELIVHDGGSLDVVGAVIHGSVVFVGGGTLRICGTRFDGDVIVYAGHGSIVLGDTGPGCPGNSIEGTVVITSNRGLVTLRHSQLHGLVVVEHNLGGITVADNVIRGKLIVRDNAAPIQSGDNQTSIRDR